MLGEVAVVVYGVKRGRVEFCKGGMSVLTMQAFLVTVDPIYVNSKNSTLLDIVCTWSSN